MVGLALGHDGVYTWLDLMWADETDLTVLLGCHTVEGLLHPGGSFAVASHGFNGSKTAVNSLGHPEPRS